MSQDEQGYSIFEQVFDRTEMAAAVEALARADMVRTKAGARHVLAVPIVRALATDPRLIRLAAEFVGPEPVPFRATLFDKSPTSNWLVVWHQDTALPMKSRVDDPAWVSWSTKAGVLYAHAPAWALETVVALRLRSPQQAVWSRCAHSRFTPRPNRSTTDRDASCTLNTR